MSAIVDVAPQGDLVVAVGKGETQRLARISSALVKLVSPVFNAMFGPSFREGQTRHDASNPLKLPDDDPVAMLNLFHILHWNSHKTDDSQEDWFYNLVVVCDKYQCSLKMQDYICRRLSPPLECLSSVDLFVISGLIDDEKRFNLHADTVVRMTMDDALDECHEKLLPFLPEDMLARMKEYRLKARLAYREVTSDIITEIHFSEHVNNDFVACHGLQIRLAAFYKILMDEGILTLKCSDSDLCDMKNSLSEVEYGGLRVKHCEHKCPADCPGCDLNFRDFIDAACENLVLGTPDHCEVCLGCFKQREFNFRHECSKHNDTLSLIRMEEE